MAAFGVRRGRRYDSVEKRRRRSPRTGWSLSLGWDMELGSLLEESRESILGRWFELIRNTYPRITSEFLAQQEDQFRNPVGHAIRESIGPIYDQVVSAMDRDELLRGLDGIIRIRSVQEFTPAVGFGFVFKLKTVIGVVVDGLVPAGVERDGLAELESRIDRVALLAFEKYTECREKLHEVRNKEIKGRTMKLLERVNAESPVSQHREETVDDEI